LRCKVTNAEKNEQLYLILARKSLTLFITFVRCLLETKQHQVVSLLAPDLVSNSRPLSDEQQSRLQVNYAAIVRLLDSKNGLLAELLSVDCITWRQKEYIESASTQSESNTRPVDLVRRGSETDFTKFITCLNKTAQIT